MLATAANAGAVSLDELVAAPGLTPKSFAKLFEEFDYLFREQVQRPEVFLASRKGDCDDYAVLADHVLRKRGFTTRLIHVRLVGQIAHAVCYVVETKAYLDYNDRRYFFKLTRARNRVRTIAAEVADSLTANWTSASEFTYDYESETKRIIQTVVKLEPAEQDPDAAKES